MAHETSFIVEYSDSEDDLYNDMFDSDCEGMSSAEELDLELRLFDDNSRNLDSPYSEDITVGPSEEAETYHKGGDHDGNQRELSSSRSSGKGAGKRRMVPQGNGGVGRKKSRLGRVGVGRVGVGRVTMVTKGYDNVDIPHELPPFTPSRPTGIHVENHLEDGMTTELDFFNLFFTKDMIDSIVTHTNACAYIKLAEGGYLSYANGQGAWDETNAEEIRCFIALLIYFGLNQCKSLYQPTQNMTVEERMVGSGDKPGIYRRYRRADTTTRSGIKLWVLGDTSNGFIVDFNIYIGKSAYGEVSENGLGYDLVMKLATPYLNQGYHLYLQKCFTSFKLVSDLFSNGTPSTGVVSVGKVGFPTSLSDVKEWARTVEFGDMRWERLSNILTLQWLDHQPISILTTIDSANEVALLHRKVKRDNKLEKIDVNVPKVIQKYNQCINKVHRYDHTVMSNNVLQKCYKWWKTLLFHLIDMSVINSFILFQEQRRNNPDNNGLERGEKYYSIVEFREALVRQICGLADYDVPPSYVSVKAVHEYETIHIPK
ncbi:Hypothetical predicted protein, partial [Paramuricea clavata]